MEKELSWKFLGDKKLMAFVVENASKKDQKFVFETAADKYYGFKKQKIRYVFETLPEKWIYFV